MNVKKSLPYLILILLFTAWGCAKFIKAIDDDRNIVLDAPNDKLSIIFSANINGETHPCGCRHFPLGGFDHVAGLMHIESQSNQLFYVDTGDIFFPSNNIPTSVQDSLTHTAKTISHSLSLLGLKFFVPGDQDLTLGTDFLSNLLSPYQHKMLVANRASNFPFAAQSWIKLEKGNSKIYLVGVTSPDTFRMEHRHLFTEPQAALKTVMEEIEDDGYDSKNNFHRLILLSHGGIDFDRQMAKVFPQINWVIGSHTQSFIKIPFEEGKTQLVQVMSRNHYLGKIEIALNGDRGQDNYSLLEVRDHWAEKLPSNPLIPILHQHKEELAKVQLEEQKKLTVDYSGDFKKYDTAKTCLECHSKQGDHWQKTAHSLAYLTLVKAKAENNRDCIQCHSVGLNEPRGYQKTDELVQFEYTHSHDGQEHSHGPEDVTHFSQEDLQALSKKRGNYWKNVLTKMPVDKSIRSLSPETIAKSSREWLAMDEKHKVTHNFANVQCLNCHTKHQDHPFNMSSEDPDPRDKRPEQIKAKCLSCHNPDQSPEWHTKEGKVNEVYFDKVYKKVACPKNS